MKGAIAICLFVLAAVTLARPDGATYTNKYDHVNLEEILSSQRLLNTYVQCINDHGKCTPEGKELKTHLHEALQTDCAKCTPAQRDGADRVIKFLILNKPDTWAELKAKHDPTGKFSKKHEDRIKAVKA